MIKVSGKITYVVKTFLISTRGAFLQKVENLAALLYHNLNLQSRANGYKSDRYGLHGMYLGLELSADF